MIVLVADWDQDISSFCSSCFELNWMIFSVDNGREKKCFEKKSQKSMEEDENDFIERIEVIEIDMAGASRETVNWKTWVICGDS